ncbi:unnamed protein product [Amoebophrya sp. A25]|nr:unnamed protein product [Amoebophrya sp. A25]|eukprot:GSA25T00025840001.1
MPSADNTSPGRVRRELAQRRSRWMREHALASECVEDGALELGSAEGTANLAGQQGASAVQQATNSTSTTTSSTTTTQSVTSDGGYSVARSRDTELLARLQERIEKSVRTEVVQEIATRNVEKELERLVADKLSSYSCPICMNVMHSGATGPGDGGKEDRSPLLLFPCGHNLCAHCNSQLKKPLCPYCRTKIEHKAINRPLQEMIAAFENPAHVTDTLNSDHPGGALYGGGPHGVTMGSTVDNMMEVEQQLGSMTPSAATSYSNTSAATATPPSTASTSSSLQKAQYERQYRHFLARANVLSDELDLEEGEARKTAEEDARLASQIAADEAEVATLFQKWEAAKQRLEGAKRDRKQCQRKREESERRVNLLRTTLQPLERDRDKYKILLEHL